MVTSSELFNVNIRDQKILLTPAELHQQLPASEAAQATILHSRQTIEAILNGDDPRLLVVVGPCSIHDTKAALDYAKQLKVLAEKVKDTLYIVMRVYFEKPRTTVGWKGLINDPFLDDSFQVEEGLKIGRTLLNDLASLGLPTATEALDPISPQYLHDLISWAAIGARTTESQTHREMSSGLSTAVGFKNGTDGNLTVAINALQSVANPHRFLGINRQGQVAIIHTRGNPHSHIVLRGGGGKPNYDSVNVALCEQALHQKGLRQNIMIDCSHANSNKDAALQPLVLDNITQQIVEGNHSIFGVMIESHLNWGNQSLKSPDELAYGVSITDACIDFPTTEKALSLMAEKLACVLPERSRKAFLTPSH